MKDAERSIDFELVVVSDLLSSRSLSCNLPSGQVVKRNRDA